MKYQHKQFDDVQVKATEAKENTTIKHPEYGDILVTPGNYIVEYTSGPNKGEKVGMAASDFELQFEKIKG